MKNQNFEKPTIKPGLKNPGFIRVFPNFGFFAYPAAKTVNEIHGDFISTFPDSTIKKWRKDFANSSFALEKNTSSGRPWETRTPENIAAVKRLIEDNLRMTTRQVAT
ncbi:Uncharacterized protein FKW44_000218 [Caligus rogercresseyi]|uniref:Uncharacterized protein n=1 Tax=Caligus rogercresseyi TaxID=217165 RepID=A0A7T8QUR0_CALRO|nr:Uncharacterized protein FKW44_000218 [Caligus rogercresseyi]